MGSHFRRLRRRFARLSPRAARAELDEEIRLHLELETEKLVRAGVPPAEARRQAVLAFGGVEKAREETRDERRFAWAEDAGRDLAHGLRLLRRSPGFAVVAVTTLALGIGAATAAFGLLHAVLFAPLPYASADELVVVYARNPGRGWEGSNISYPDYLSWKQESRSLRDLAIFNWWDGTLSGRDAAERISGAEISANLFPLLGVSPQLGRPFTEAEAAPGGGRVAILGHALWQRRYGGDSAVVGRAIEVDGVPRTVVGVMPPGFMFPSDGELWIPLVPEAVLDERERSSRYLAGAVGRLGSGASLAQLEAEMASISRQLEASHPDANRGWEAQVVPLRDDVAGELGPAVTLIFAAVGLVLLVVCGNVASLLLARGLAREREVGVRSALGAGRLRLVRQLVAESVALALAGGVVGAVLAFGIVRGLAAALGDRLPSYAQLAFDGRVLAFMVAITLASAVAAGVVPAFRTTAIDAGASLKEGARGTSSLRGARLRSALVVAQVALALVLLSGSLLLVRSLAALRGIDPGFDAARVLTARIYLPETEYPDSERRAAFLSLLLERLRGVPGVEVAGAAQGTPFSGWNVGVSVAIERAGPAPRGEEPETHFQIVSQELFTALGVPVIRGRGFLPRDDSRAPEVCLVNQAFASRYLSGAEPLGERIRLGGHESPDPWRTIVGVVADFRHYDLTEPMRPAVYVHYREGTPRQMTLLLRGGAGASGLAGPLRGVLAELDRDVPAYRVEPLAERVARQTWVQAMQRDVLVAFAAVVVFLALVGLNGVIAYAVTRRRREIGIRLALGASPGRLRGHFVAQGLRLAGVGTVVGAGAALAAARGLSATLYGVAPSDPFTYLAAAVGVSALAIVASYLPARRASRVNPALALHSE